MEIQTHIYSYMSTYSWISRNIFKPKNKHGCGIFVHTKATTAQQWNVEWGKNKSPSGAMKKKIPNIENVEALLHWAYIYKQQHALTITHA